MSAEQQEFKATFELRWEVRVLKPTMAELFDPNRPMHESILQQKWVSEDGKVKWVDVSVVAQEQKIEDIASSTGNDLTNS